MGFRKAAMQRRKQHISGHHRTNKNGKTYWVKGMFETILARWAYP